MKNIGTSLQAALLRPHRGTAQMSRSVFWGLYLAICLLGLLALEAGSVLKGALITAEWGRWAFLAVDVVTAVVLLYLMFVLLTGMVRRLRDSGYRHRAVYGLLLTWFLSFASLLNDLLVFLQSAEAEGQVMMSADTVPISPLTLLMVAAALPFTIYVFYGTIRPSR